MTARNLLGLMAAGALMVFAAIPGHAKQSSDEAWQRIRDEMVARQLEARAIRSERVLAAMREIPRHAFVPESARPYAYRDHALQIGYGQTISQPYIVALMTELLDPQPDERILEIGTGSGYQAAILSKLAGEVYTIEIIPELGREAAERLKALGFENVEVRIGDGYLGWPEQAPFDAVMVTAAPENIPEPLIEQLREGGRLVIPMGAPDRQMLYVGVKQKGELVRKAVIPVRFVPMTGRAQETRSRFADAFLSTRNAGSQ